MKDTATVKIFLAQGSPSSVRTAELSNWTGKAVAGPRSQIEDILKRVEADNPGVYFLTGINPETAKSVGRFELENTQSSGSHLPESDAADMDIFLFRMEQLLPILGQEFLKPVVKHEVSGKKSDLLYCEIKNLKAAGRQTDNGFVVLKDSEVVLKERPSTHKYRYAANLRKTLLAENVLEEKNDRLLFISDYEFSSPSAAAAVIHGGQANGLTAWKNSKGVSLKQKEEKGIQQLNSLDSE
ncbi:MAG: DUF4357 domain-containing protein [Desulfobacterales bacterium]|nr:DUF4357 domain-containing protein [Desulfobacterales bacterium]